MLPEENAQQVERFLAGAPEFRMMPYTEVWATVFECAPPVSAVAGGGLQLTPARHGTDGFFIAVLANAG
jgi:16S rRNA (cytosine967-C5)-methyltransferase